MTAQFLFEQLAGMTEDERRRLTLAVRYMAWGRDYDDDVTAGAERVIVTLDDELCFCAGAPVYPYDRELKSPEAA